MSTTGVALPTSIGRRIGVHRFCLNPRGTLNSSKSLFVRFNNSMSAASTRDRVVFHCVGYCEADTIRTS
jgi:hypothetical protein